MVVAACSSSGGGGAKKPSTDSTSGEPTVYMIGQVTNSTFWAAVQKGFLAGAAAFHLHGIYEAPQDATPAQYDPLVDAALARHPAGIAINYTSKGIQPPTLAALKDGVAVTLFNSEIFQATPGQPGTATTDPAITSLPYVGEDLFDHAVALTHAFVTHLKPHATVLIVDPIPGLLVLAIRRSGVESVLNQVGDKSVYLPASLDLTTNYSVIGSYLTAHPGIDGIIGLGTPTADPAAEYVQKHDLHIPVATFDVDSGALHYLQAGVITDATDQEPYLQGYLSAMNLMLEAVDHLHPVTVEINNYIVTPQTVGSLKSAVAKGLD
jgi:simple sugar transport system substrate-binding protein